MKGHFLISSNQHPAQANIYSDKSALIINWLLQKGSAKQSFSLREVVKETEVSIGLAQRVFSTLVLTGLLQVEGVRTAKRFFFNQPKKLLENWLEHYSIIKKCKIRTYCSSFQDKNKLLDVLKKSNLSQKVAIALHSAAEMHGYKNTNLNTLELYILDSFVRPELEKVLQLEPQEKGYEILLIEPYYKTLLKKHMKKNKNIRICPIFLTFLDLYHFPLRGQEQADFIAQRAPEIKHMYRKAKNK